ncbi:hypothetical protein [Halomonas cerina]|uniref:Methyl-accepting chemotaxis protein n=1 Tax=Halomonas cerina TaxID=447424 RepID=A0A839VCV5_9GAMM|nr:hypothetical protein [Halomonas cerina]MBB3191229.1 methyl-accepting chemotaxis protein [Halomonas cerina]
MKRQLLRKLALSLLIGMTALGLAACEEEGPAEQAGESIDESAEEMEQNIDESAEEMGEGMEEMGDEMEETAEEAQN